jgi:hypothetical protein
MLPQYSILIEDNCCDCPSGYIFHQLVGIFLNKELATDFLRDTSIPPNYKVTIVQIEDDVNFTSRRNE